MHEAEMSTQQRSMRSFTCSHAKSVVVPSAAMPPSTKTFVNCCHFRFSSNAGIKKAPPLVETSEEEAAALARTRIEFGLRIPF